MHPQALVSAKRIAYVAITIPSNAGPPTKLSALLAAGGFAAGGDTIAGVRISGKQKAVTTNRAAILVGNAATSAGLAALSEEVAAGADWKEACCGVGDLYVGAAANADVPALAIVFLT